MRTLYLHIGHSKTGSSYLQTCFAASGDTLQAHGLVYPFADTSSSGNVAEHQMTTGNAMKAFASLQSLSDHLAAVPDDGRSVLLSSEFFIRHLADPLQIPGMLDVARRYGFGHVCLLLFVREPLSMQMSRMRQRLKNPTLKVTPLSSLAETIYDRAFRMHTYLEALQGHSGITATVRNYGRVRDRLVSVAEAWLGIPEGSLTRPTAGVVNRSLNADEAFFISSVKENMSPPFPNLGWPLVERMPELTALPRWPSREIQEQICLRVQDSLEALNRYLPPDEPLVFDFREPSPPMTEVSLKGGQLEIMGSGMSILMNNEALQVGGIGWLRRSMMDVRPHLSGMPLSDWLSRKVPSSVVMLGSIDLVGGRPCPGRDLPLSVCGRVSGWAALDPGRGLAGDAVFLLWEPKEGRGRLHGCLPVRRPDVAAALGQDGLIWCGFETREPFDPRGHTGRLHLLVSHAGAMYRNEGLVWELLPTHAPETT